MSISTLTAPRREQTLRSADRAPKHSLVEVSSAAYDLSRRERRALRRAEREPKQSILSYNPSLLLALMASSS